MTLVKRILERCGHNYCPSGDVSMMIVWQFHPRRARAAGVQHHRGCANWPLGVVVAAAALVSLAGCTPPPEKPEAPFHVIEERVLHTQMKQMSTHLAEVTELTMGVGDTAGGNPALKAQVLAQLDTIEGIARGIDADNAITNWSVINRYMGAFIYDVRVAREFAADEPPNYVPANRLIRSCLSCHSSL